MFALVVKDEHCSVWGGVGQRIHGFNSRLLLLELALQERIGDGDRPVFHVHQEPRIEIGALGVFEGETGGHVGFVRGDKLLGGNQGDSVKYSNLAWFKSNMKLLGYRWPSDYPIPT